MIAQTPLPGQPQPIRPPASWKWLHSIVDHNPCFLLSAVCMFLGCYLLNSALDVRAADIARALLLLATINVYEFALLAVGFGLLGKPGGRGRDGVLLLTIELLFLADAPFLVAQLVQVSLGFGWLIAVAFAVLALLKVILILHGAGIPFRGRTFGFLLLQILLIYGLPVVMSHLAVGGELSARAMLGAWWAVGLLPLVYDFVARLEPTAPSSRRQEFLRRAMIVIPWLLLVAHVIFFHYIYRADFIPSDLSPVLLGLAVATRRIAPTAFCPARQLRIVRLILPAIAILLAISGSNDVTIAVPLTLHGTLAPASVTVAAALIIYGYFISSAAAIAALGAVILMAIGWMFSARIFSVTRAVLAAAGRAATFILHHTPASAAAWGVFAVVTAFILLGAGALWSLRDGKHLGGKSCRNNEPFPPSALGSRM